MLPSSHSLLQPPPIPSIHCLLHHGIVIIMPGFSLILETTIKSTISLTALGEIQQYTEVFGMNHEQLSTL